MGEKKKIEFLVADTAAFIQNKALQDLAENVITCQKVIEEVRNKRQVKRLAVLPYDLQIKDVFPENIKFVHEIAKQTGDYRSLSATDIEVIALTYQLEKEKVGTEHLKDSVEMKKSISLTNQSTTDVKDIAGFYLPSKDGQESKQLAEKLEQLTCDVEDKLELEKDPLSEDSCGESPDNTNSEPSDNEEDPELSDEENPEVNEISKNEEEDGHPVDDLSLPGSLPYKDNQGNDGVDNVNVEDILVKVSTDTCQQPRSEGQSDSEEEYEEEEEDDDDDDDEGGWITPANVKQAKIDMDQMDYEDENAKVACITTDFAMQNVLKQIGLKVASLDGRIIKQIRTYIFRCYGCFKTTDDMTKVFCPSCGHNTLKRVSVTLEPDGTQKIHINAKRPLTMRGRRFQLPVFKGGKHANNPIVTADQRVPDQKPTRVARTKTNIMESDFIEGFSPFAIRDTNSRSAVLGIREQKQLRRPNLYRPRSGKKK